MKNIESFQDIFASELMKATSWEFLLNLILTGFFAYLLGKIYVQFGQSLSNRKAFSKIYVLLSLTTMLVISIVQSSLALSLGLIGALSIVRFRAAIKEPEELTYLFFCIAIGLGFGANQRFKTIIAFCIIYFLIRISSKVSNKISAQHGYLSITSSNPDKWDAQEISDIIAGKSEDFKLRRFDKMEKSMEILFLVANINTKKLELIDRQLRESDQTIKINFANTSDAF